MKDKDFPPKGLETDQSQAVSPGKFLCQSDGGNRFHGLNGERNAEENPGEDICQTGEYEG